MYSEILIPLDGSNFSEQILPYARFFAAAFKIPVALLHVANPDARPPFWPEQTGDAYLGEIAEKYFAASVGVRIESEVGVPEEVIVNSARKDPLCLIAMATHGMSGMRRWLIGSVASGVVQAGANPLLLIRPSRIGDPSATVELHTALVPLDGSGLGEKALPHVCSLAKATDMQVQFLHVYSVPRDPPIVTNAVTARASSQYREQLAQEALTYLDGVAAALPAEGIHKVATTAVAGDVAGEIIDLARRTPNSLIVMSTHGRSGIRRWALGSVAEKVVQYSRDPVLLVRAA